MVRLRSTDPAERNRRLLQAYAAARPSGRKVALRNALVAANLALVWAIASRYRHRTDLPLEDLTQVGCIGLIRAVEAYDPARAVNLSTFAVPYVRGAIQHEVRDRQSLMRIPRDLWELRQQASAAQEKRRRLGEAPLGESRLASELTCTQERLREALDLRQVTAMRSLDAPMGLPGQDADQRTLLESLHLPADANQGQPHPPERDPLASPESAWLRRQLSQIDPGERELLEGRLIVGCTWVELGERLGMHPRQAQRRFHAALTALRRSANEWQATASQATASQPIVQAA